MRIRVGSSVAGIARICALALLAGCSFDTSGTPSVDGASADGNFDSSIIDATPGADAPPGCMNGTCEPDENSCNCPQDCGTFCPDGCCNGAETQTNCATDCGGSACNQSCSTCSSGCCTERNADPTCDANSCFCELQCANTADGPCDAVCNAPNTCHIDCRQIDTCPAVCNAGSVCSINCEGHDDGCSVTCNTGAQCLLRCLGAGSPCEFSTCDTGPQSCPGEIIACNAPCP